MISAFKKLCLVFVAVLYTGPLNLAAQTIEHKVTPRVIDVDVSARDIIEETITLENLSSSKITIYPTVNAVVVDEGGDVIAFTPPSMSDNSITVTSWIEITRAGIELIPNEKREVPLTLRIHPEAKSGVYHAFIGFGAGQNRDVAERQVNKGSAPGTIVTIAVAQDQTEFMKLNAFTVARFVTTPDNNAISYHLTNPGETTIIPRGEIIISDTRGVEVATVPVNPDSIALDPGQERDFSTPVPIDGLIGKYKAFLSVDYGTEHISSLQDTDFFYVVPWRHLLGAFFVLLFITMLLTLVLARRYRDDDDTDDHSTHTLPLYVRNTVSENKDHDIDLRSSQ